MASSSPTIARRPIVSTGYHRRRCTVPWMASGVGRDEILAQIRRCAEQNGGQPLGRDRFAAVTGIAETDWSGRYWVRWNDAIAEAGFAPNVMQGATADGELLRQLANLTLDLGRFPTNAELRLRRRSDPDFPSHNVFERLGSKSERVNRLADFTRDDPTFASVHSICVEMLSIKRPPPAEKTEQVERGTTGIVYMLQAGDRYKIGRTNHLGRRDYEISRQSPVEIQHVHSFVTDDPIGIESYWHERFADKRVHGEWFELSRADVAAFKRRQGFM